MSIFEHLKKIAKLSWECFKGGLDILSEVGYYSKRRTFMRRLHSCAWADGALGHKPKSLKEIKSHLKFDPILGYTDGYIMQVYKIEYEEGQQLADEDVELMETEVDIWEDDK